jgi:hypothetical protein
LIVILRGALVEALPARSPPMLTKTTEGFEGSITALEPTASPPSAEAFARFGACRFSRRGSALGR